VENINLQPQEIYSIVVVLLFVFWTVMPWFGFRGRMFIAKNVVESSDSPFKAVLLIIRFLVVPILFLNVVAHYWTFLTT